MLTLWDHEPVSFRRASVLLIVTWVPFPMFYALSTEGLGDRDAISIRFSVQGLTVHPFSTVDFVHNY